MPSLVGDALAATLFKGRLVAKLGRLHGQAGRQRIGADVNRDLLNDLLETSIRQGTESSNGLEGVVLAPERYHAIMVRKEPPSDRTEQMVASYRDALDFIHRHHEELEVTPESIKSLYLRMFAQVPGVVSGEFRTQRVDIWRRDADEVDRVVYTPSPPELVAHQIEQLCRDYRRLVDDADTDRFLLLAAFVLDFTCIHPYEDGNGRLSRLLTTLVSYQLGFDVVKYVSLERVVADTKASYYFALTESSHEWHRSRHRLDPWLEYLMGAYLEAYGRLERKLAESAGVRGHKTDRILRTLETMPTRFTLSELRDSCPGVSHALIVGILAREREAGRIETVGKGPKAYYRKRSVIDNRLSIQSDTRHQFEFLKRFAQSYAETTSGN